VALFPATLVIESGLQEPGGLGGEAFVDSEVFLVLAITDADDDSLLEVKPV
jgi:hypothetical protein